MSYRKKYIISLGLAWSKFMHPFYVLCTLLLHSIVHAAMVTLKSFTDPDLVRRVLWLAVSKGDVDFVKYFVTEQSVDVNGESSPPRVCRAC